MVEEPKHHHTFKRVETDAEFRARLIAAGVDSWEVKSKEAEKLDALGWDKKKMQRRIVDDYA